MSAVNGGPAPEEMNGGEYDDENFEDDEGPPQAAPNQVQNQMLKLNEGAHAAASPVQPATLASSSMEAMP